MLQLIQVSFGEGTPAAGNMSDFIACCRLAEIGAIVAAPHEMLFRHSNC